MKMISGFKSVATWATSVALVFSLGACGKQAETEEPAAEEAQATEVATTEDVVAEEGTTSQTDQQTIEAPEEQARLDTLVLVNPTHRLPDGWEDRLVLVDYTNPKGDDVRLDQIAYDAFGELQEDLLNNYGVEIYLNSGYRSIEEQQAIWDEFMVEYGEDYVLEFVAEPGYSEHHTGLALDAYLVLDGVPQLTNDEIFAAEDTWAIIHSRLADHGFILRYLPDREDTTGYTYEPWHFRYVGVEPAQEIMGRNITLEEYLGEA
jgi:D-alanyl-D-alanine carboxypeptidase